MVLVVVLYTLLTVFGIPPLGAIRGIIMHEPWSLVAISLVQNFENPGLGSDVLHNTTYTLSFFYQRSNVSY